MKFSVAEMPSLLYDAQVQGGKMTNETPLEIQLKLPENPTESDVKTAVEAAIPEFVRKLHNAHLTSRPVKLQTKIIKQT